MSLNKMTDRPAFVTTRYKSFDLCQSIAHYAHRYLQFVLRVVEDYQITGLLALRIPLTLDVYTLLFLPVVEIYLFASFCFEARSRQKKLAPRFETRFKRRQNVVFRCRVLSQVYCSSSVLCEFNFEQQTQILS